MVIILGLSILEEEALEHMQERVAPSSTAGRAARGALLRALRHISDGTIVLVDADGEHAAGASGGLSARIDVHSLGARG